MVDRRIGRGEPFSKFSSQLAPCSRVCFKIEDQRHRMGCDKRLIRSTPILAASQENSEWFDAQLRVLRTRVSQLHIMMDGTRDLLVLVHVVPDIVGGLRIYGFVTIDSAF